MVCVLEKEGMNVWEARMLARVLLDYPIRSRPVWRKQFGFNKSGKRALQWVPTTEDILDLNFHSIVSDCRGIVRGTLVPRAWQDLSSTWVEIEHINRAQYPPEPAYKTVYRERKQAQRNQVEVRTGEERKFIRKIQRILMMQGMEKEVARQKAETLLLGPTKGEV
jgi:hypothetical protein